MPETPRVFWAVRAVIAVMAKHPRADIVLMSAWMPAPPPLSEPAMDRTVLYRFVVDCDCFIGSTSYKGICVLPGDSLIGRLVDWKGHPACVGTSPEMLLPAGLPQFAHRPFDHSTN
jgi:hypothetical protein